MLSSLNLYLALLLFKVILKIRLHKDIIALLVMAVVLLSTNLTSIDIFQDINF